MPVEQQNGYFEISAEDIEGNELLVPRDNQGLNPEGRENTEQSYYRLITRDQAKIFAVWVVNNTDADIQETETQGTHLWDEEWEHAQEVAIEEQPGEETYLLNQESAVDFLNQYIEFDQEPTEGELIVVIRSADK